MARPKQCAYCGTKNEAGGKNPIEFHDSRSAVLCAACFKYLVWLDWWRGLEVARQARRKVVTLA